MLTVYDETLWTALPMEKFPLAVGQKWMWKVRSSFSLFPHQSALAQSHGSRHLENVKFSVIQMRTRSNFVFPPISAIRNHRDCSSEESPRDAQGCHTHIGVFHTRNVCIGNNYCVNNNTQAFRVARSIKNAENTGNITGLHKY
jgi:hypothetical protein